MYARVSVPGYSTVSAIWNAAYDIGMAAGAIGVGMLITTTGFTPAFLLTAAAMLPELLMAHRERAARSVRSSAELKLGGVPALA